MQNEDLIADVPAGGEAPAIDIREYLLMFQRRWRLFLSVALGLLLLVVLVTFQQTPKYTAVSSVLVERQTQQVVDLSSASTTSALPTDSASVDTEAEVMKSRSVAEKVVTTLKLDQDPEFNGALKKKAGAPLFGGNSRGVNAGDLARREFEQVVDTVLKGLSVKRQGLTYVIELGFTSKDPLKGARIANAFAQQYLVSQVDSKVDANERNARELNGRLEAVRQEAEAADAALQQYKIENNLLSTQGSSLTEQEITNLDQQLALVSVQQAESDANLETARGQIARGSSGEDIAGALNSPVVQQLRAQRAVLSQQAASLSDRYGPLYPDRVKAETAVTDIDKQIKAEIRRVVSNLKAQADVGRERTATLQGAINEKRNTLVSNSRAATQLNILQNKATTARAIYEAFLNSFKQSAASAGLEQSGARIVSIAKVPTRPSSPNKPLNIALGLLLGLGAGVGAVFLREALDSGLTTADSVEQQMDTPFLGGVPDLDSVRGDDEETRDLEPIDYLVKKPLSSFSEAFRNLRTSITFSRPGHPIHVVAITSTLPGEGKTTTSWCLTRTTALAGTRVVLVDCDLRRRTASHKLAEVPRVGLIEVLSGAVSLDEALIQDSATSAMILPVSRSGQSVKDVFGTPEMEKLLNTLKERFEMVILDTAPVIAVSDTRVIGREADAVVVLARWRKTPRKAIEAALRALTSTGAYVSGLSLTMIDAKQQARYGYGDPGYYYSSSSGYYTE